VEHRDSKVVVTGNSVRAIATRIVQSFERLGRFLGEDNQDRAKIAGFVGVVLVPIMVVLAVLILKVNFGLSAQ